MWLLTLVGTAFATTADVSTAEKSALIDLTGSMNYFFYFLDVLGALLFLAVVFFLHLVYRVKRDDSTRKHGMAGNSKA